jgi:hypothetical protein
MNSVAVSHGLFFVYVVCEIGTVHQFSRAADTATSQVPHSNQPLSDAWVGHVVSQTGWQNKWLRQPNYAYLPPRLERSLGMSTTLTHNPGEESGRSAEIHLSGYDER